MSDENNEDTKIKGGLGPGEGYVGTGGLIGLIIYVALVIGLVLWGIEKNLPECASLTGNSNVAANTNANIAGNTNANTGGTNQNQRSGSNNANAANSGNTNTNSANSSGNSNAGNTNATTPGATTSTGGSTSTGGTTTPGTGNTNSNANANVKIKIDTISPASGIVNGNTSVLIKGQGFVKDTKVFFGGLGAEKIKPDSSQIEPDSSDSLLVQVPRHETTGLVDVIVRNPNGNSDISQKAFTYVCSTIPSSQMLLIVVLAGMIGAALHALRSLVWYIGNRELRWSWVPMYILLPFSGAATAVVFYLVISGGFLNAPSDRQTYWYIIAIGVMVGMFSQQAALKLQDIANVALTKPGAGSNSVPQGSNPISTQRDISKPAIKPTEGLLAGGEVVEISGTGFKSVKSVMFGDKPATEVALDPKTGVIKAKTPASSETGRLDVSIEDNNGKKITLDYTYK